jgi:hypothetical protein
MSRLDRMFSYMRPDYTVCFTLRVDFNDKDTARELKCFWSPDDKKWKKSFNMKYYPHEDIHSFLRIVKRFMQTCYDCNFKIEDDEGLEDLQDAVDEDNAIIEKCNAKPKERHIPIAPGPLDTHRGRGTKCLIVDDE